RKNPRDGCREALLAFRRRGAGRTRRIGQGREPIVDLVSQRRGRALLEDLFEHLLRLFAAAFLLQETRLVEERSIPVKAARALSLVRETPESDDRLVELTARLVGVGQPILGGEAELLVDAAPEQPLVDGGCLVGLVQGDEGAGLEQEGVIIEARAPVRGY